MFHAVVLSPHQSQHEEHAASLQECRDVAFMCNNDYYEKCDMLEMERHNSFKRNLNVNINNKNWKANLDSLQQEDYLIMFI